MSKALRILILEDRPADADLVTRELRKAGFEFVAKTVTTEKEFLDELRNSAPEVILANYSLPTYDGLSALAAAQQQCLETPFIFVSGTLGEERAIETLRQGATDYVLKDRLARLGPAVRRALREREEMGKREQADKERHEAEARYHALFEQLPDGIVIMDPETGRLLEFNAAAHQQLGYSREEFAWLSLADLEAARTPEQIRATVDGVRREGKMDFETLFRTREGQIRHVHVTAQVVEVSGRPVHHGILRDITERKGAEEALRASEARYRMLFNGSADGILIADTETKTFKYANPVLCRMLGYTQEELRTMGVLDIHPKDAVQSVVAEFEAQARGDKTLATDIPCLRKDGSVVHADINAVKITIDDRPCNVGFFRDITERKRAEEAVRDSERRFRSLAEATSQIIWFTDGHGQVFGPMPSWQAYTGQTDEEIRGSGWSRALHADDLPRTIAIWTNAVAGKTGYETEYRVRRHDGDYRHFAVRGVPVVADDGSIREWVGTCSDITERKRAEAALRQREEYFRALTERASDVTTILNADGTIQYQSPSVEQVFGYQPDELVGRSAFDLIHPEDLARMQQALAESIAIPGSTARIEVRLRHKNGSWRALEATARNLLNDPNVKGIVTNSRDITERKQLEEALRESSQFNQQIVASAQEGIIVYGRDLKHQAWNPFMEQLTGIPAAQVLGKHPDEVFPFLRDTGVLASIKKALAGEPNSSLDHHFEGLPSGKSGWASDANGPLRNAAGEIIGVIGFVRDITERKRAEESHARLVTAVEQSAETIMITDVSDTILYINPAFEKTSGYNRAEVLGRNPRILKSGKHDAEFYRQMWTVLGRGEVWSGRLINKKKDGTLYEEDATISPVRDPAGKVVNYVAVKRDVTHEARLETQLRQAQKMEAVGQLAGGVAHDFNNMLAVIRGNAELLLMDEDQHTAETREGLKHVVEASERAANLTRQLLTFSRKQVLLPQPLVLNEVIANLTKMLNRVIRENIDLQCEYAAALPYVQADTGMMEQVILNLVVNARDAMPEGGHLRVATEQVTLDEAHARVNPKARAGEFVCLLVSDTGTGIAPEVLPRIFEPFFTTKDIGKGTGLGLATVYGIVQQHQGWIEVSSQVGKGSTFKVLLPAIPTPARLAAAAEAGTEAGGGTETILLVEDEHSVRLTTRRVLESKGYKIQEATSAQEALEQWHSHAGEIALLLSDIIMPGEMTGRDLAERLLGQKPGLKVIFMSGYSAEVLGKNTDFFRRTRSHFLQKPCTSRAILETVRQCLDDKEPVAGSGEAGRAK